MSGPNEEVVYAEMVEWRQSVKWCVSGKKDGRFAKDESCKRKAPAGIATAGAFDYEGRALNERGK